MLLECLLCMSGYFALVQSFMLEIHLKKGKNLNSDMLVLHLTFSLRLVMVDSYVLVRPRNHQEKIGTVGELNNYWRVNSSEFRLLVNSTVLTFPKWPLLSTCWNLETGGSCWFLLKPCCVFDFRDGQTRFTLHFTGCGFEGFHQCSEGGTAGAPTCWALPPPAALMGQHSIAKIFNLVGCKAPEASWKERACGICDPGHPALYIYVHGRAPSPASSRAEHSRVFQKRAEQCNLC
ncbi:hypothetical protein PR202_ga08778 [Eleusine coracana subsp. coracana]|uniref:Uncharacterized protein n=1 Tax=Eleusine coracana subsp. coracana TaxID=191504 RepID=A0AAV5C1D8_ELECO|nr:hypothetical protein PR202_ga08778 [Eleusine coracana subsp. coracana]